MGRDQQVGRRGEVTNRNRVRDSTDAGHVWLQNVERLTSDHVVECRWAIQTFAAGASRSDMPAESFEASKISRLEGFLDPVHIVGFQSVHPGDSLIDRPRLIRV